VSISERGRGVQHFVEHLDEGAEQEFGGAQPVVQRIGGTVLVRSFYTGLLAFCVWLVRPRIQIVEILLRAARCAHCLRDDQHTTNKTLLTTMDPFMGLLGK
jgi:hypothetical protein